MAGYERVAQAAIGGRRALGAGWPALVTPGKEGVEILSYKELAGWMFGLARGLGGVWRPGGALCGRLQGVVDAGVEVRTVSLDVGEDEGRSWRSLIRDEVRGLGGNLWVGILAF